MLSVLVELVLAFLLDTSRLVLHLLHERVREVS